MPLTKETTENTTPLVLIVDDSRAVRAFVRELLEQVGYAVIEANDGIAGLEAIATRKPDVVLLDIEMPNKTGLEVLDELDVTNRLFSIILFTTLSSLDAIVDGLERGADDYIVKPFKKDEFMARLAAAIRIAHNKKLLFEARMTAERTIEQMRQMQSILSDQKLIEQKIRETSEAQSATIFAMAKLAESRDEDTGGHLERVREYCRELAKDLRSHSSYSDHITAEFIDCIQHAAPLHDIGKVAIPDGILQKPGKLTPEEFEAMKSHTVIGADTLQLVFNSYPGNMFIGMGIEIALYHHERWDGSGYPDGLVGKNIPLPARIMALADVYDALRSDRCYRKGLTHDQARTIILEGDGKHFDPEVVMAFLRIEGIFARIGHDI
ncbi:HD domain-containing phosphohydrolase [Geobacter sulfurreducens]|uniref:HD domain-containing phosphohydrolase n=1 Tax=Geobacter sulfurreducens TaxID=35554 RepID=UPI000DBB10D7|nr:HD domain-containing phosphohydrolase [Geobacter sulfurreducens]BBA70906.1 Cyclic di-GMP phosphodiesterase response regulator RpfG [Geobacter sulfurreducens]